MDCKHRPKGKLKGIPGHLYIFNKCIAFSSQKIKSIVLRFSNVRQVKKPSLTKNITVSLDDGSDFIFKKFKDRSGTFEIMFKAWQASKSGSNESMASSISPAGYPDSAITLDSALKEQEPDGAEQASDDSGDEESKDDVEGDVVPVIEEGFDDPNLRDPTDDELMAALNQVPVPANHRLIGQKPLAFSANEYFELFHATGSPYNFDKYYTYRGYKKIQITQDWTEQIEEPRLQEAWGEKVKQWKKVVYEVDVTGNPFVKVSPTEKNFLLVHKEKFKVVFRMWTQFKGIPYADSFNPEEQLTVVSLPKQPINPSLPYTKDVPSHRCAFRLSLQMIFHKKIPIFQGKIEKGSIEKGLESFTVQTQWASTKIEEYRMLNPLPKPKVASVV